MPFDPNLPAHGAPIVSQELRNQFNGLNDTLTTVAGQVATLPTVDEMLDTISAQAPRNVDALATLTLTISNPPTQAQVQALLNAFNSLLLALKH
jgi:uncharacterized phage infection (PIP) family protein YhgE